MDNEKWIMDNCGIFSENDFNLSAKRTPLLSIVDYQLYITYLTLFAYSVGVMPNICLN